MNDFKPCPFCGEKTNIAVYSDGGSGYVIYWYVICSCGARGGNRSSIVGAVEAWNRRYINEKV